MNENNIKETKIIHSDEDDIRVVGYFSYQNSNIADIAESERAKISKLETQLDYNNPKMVYALYNKIIEGNLFHTPEGMLYLIHLQDYLDSHEDILPGKVLPVPSEQFTGYSKGNDSEAEAQIEKLKNRVRDLESQKTKAFKRQEIKQKKTDNFILKVIIAALVVVVIVMFIITFMSSSPNIVNYRHVIENEYADWEQKLSEKEAELNAREKLVNEQGNTFGH